MFSTVVFLNHLSVTSSLQETDVNSSTGFDVLARRMKEGKTLCNDIKEYFKQR